MARGTRLVGATVTANVGIGPRSDGGFGITANLVVELPGIEREVASNLARSAQQIYPYSKATSNTIDVGLSLAGYRADGSLTAA